ncbi:hypothetical protein GFS24_14540 [Chitinophaga sp. SYP-B3965]|uniref:anti-sigma factor family protein n=1 Tax=Chitinophaga sp. SYP-B3965 TaxID=2663120 RepID=UPI001299E7B4|nr:hypothetical protein [Chitinophaga sp. SYP-B3965]MRG46338.1 hypothetical protein [Chitinophaga sp. SYP-B3965]
MSTDINISNYEDYLYSYVDGELQAEEIAALESFLEMHPQFQAELDVLMSTRLQPEIMVFSNKASLYRGSEISLQTYESHLLSYIDGELNQQEKAAFEQFVSQHAHVQQELKIWQATKVAADTSVRFEDRSVLYRKTSRRIAIRPAYWWGAAAVVAGALFFLTLSDTTETKNIVAVKQPAVTVPETAVPESGTTGAATATTTNPAVTTPETAATTGNVATAPAVAAIAPKSAPKAVRQDAAPVKEETLLAAANTADLTNIPTEKPAEQLNNKAIAQDISQQLKQIPGSEVAANRPSIEVGTPTSLATPAPAAEPGELIMSVTGNGLESKVLDKVTNVARFFARKKNK